MDVHLPLFDDVYTVAQGIARIGHQFSENGLDIETNQRSTHSRQGGENANIGGPLLGCHFFPNAGSLGLSQRKSTGNTAATPAAKIAFGSVTPAR